MATLRMRDGPTRYDVREEAYLEHIQAKLRLEERVKAQVAQASANATSSDGNPSSKLRYAFSQANKVQLEGLKSKSRRQGLSGSSSTVALKLTSDAPGWWKLPAVVAKAADDFDQHYSGLCERGRRVVDSSHRRPGMQLMRVNSAHRRPGMQLIRANSALVDPQLSTIRRVARARYITPLIENIESDSRWTRRFRKEPMAAAKEPVVEVAPAFLDLRSIWAPRKEWCDAKDFFDTDDVELKRFRKDWALACDMGLAKLVSQVDDNGDVDLDGDGLSDELQEVMAVLWDWHDMLYMVFTYYATVGLEVNFLFLNQWTEFIEECKLVSKRSQFCKKADMDLLFIAVDTATTKYWKGLITNATKRAQASTSASAGRLEQKKALGRGEFTIALVHIAVNRHIKTGELSDVSEALHRVLSHIETNVCQVALDNPNVFRRQYCYTEEVNEVLLANESSLRIVFEGLAAGSDALTGGFNALLLSLHEWRAFMRALQLLGDDLTERDSMLCFSYSRMAVIDGSTFKGNARECQLPFEGFVRKVDSNP